MWYLSTLIEVLRYLENRQKWLENAGKLTGARMTKEDQFNGSNGRLGSRVEKSWEKFVKNFRW